MITSDHIVIRGCLSEEYTDVLRVPESHLGQEFLPLCTFDRPVMSAPPVSNRTSSQSLVDAKAILWRLK